jgi:2-amino-4-hydroxy-6-hydroxymethyldihydropteridine diphosphokinase
MSNAYIALGSNLGDRPALLRSALAAMNDIPDTRLDAYSPVYRSAAVGPGEQPDYLNMVARLETSQPPAALLENLQQIEHDHGRERGQRWAARSLDLDILLYDDVVMDSPTLTIPHPRLAQRNFVLYPLYDVAPGMVLPCGTSLSALVKHCTGAGLEAVGVDIEPGR